jgi:hypothetical protein
LSTVAILPGRIVIAQYYNDHDLPHFHVKRPGMDVERWIADGPVWAPLEDWQLFAKVRIVDYGRAIEWPEPNQGPDWPQVDIDADAFWHMAQAQNAAVAAE